MNSCKEEHQPISKQTTSETTLENTEDEKADQDLLKYSNIGSLRFLDNFIYRYKNGVEEGEVVLYYDYINKLVLYHPEDDMTDFVIIDKDGEVYLFYTGEHGDKIVKRDQLTFTPDNPDKKYPLSRELAKVRSIDKKITINQETLSSPDVELKGYRLNYVQYKDSLDFYITEQIEVNNEQLHAFGQLINLDWNYPLPLGNLSSIVSQKQLIGKVTAAGLYIQLKFYAPTDFYARIGDYDYFVEDEKGKRVEEQIPLMEFAIK